MEKLSIQLALQRDLRAYPRERKIYEKLWDVKSLLCRNLDDYQKNEICADIFAWSHLKQGLWGSGYKGGLNNSDFLSESFPKTYEKITKFNVGEASRPEINYNCNEEDLPF